MSSGVEDVSVSNVWTRFGAKGRRRFARKSERELSGMIDAATGYCSMRDAQKNTV